MILFQAKIGPFGERGWRNIPFSRWLGAWLCDRVVRVVIGSCDEMAGTDYHWFDKRVKVDRLQEMRMIDSSLDLLGGA